MSILPFSKVFKCWYGERGGEDGQSEGEAREASYETKEQPRGSTRTSSRPHHSSRQSSCGVHAQAGESGLLTGIDAAGDVLARVSPAPLEGGAVCTSAAQPWMNHSQSLQYNGWLRIFSLASGPE